MKEYSDFLKSKIRISENQGFNVSIDEINPRLKPHNKLMVKWMVEGGKRACFASFGLHKTVTQLEALRLTLSKIAGGGRKGSYMLSVICAPGVCRGCKEHLRLE